MFRHEGAFGPAEPHVNLRASFLNVGVIRVAATCSANDPEAIGVDLTFLEGHRDAKFLEIVITNSCVPITELWLLGSACDLGIY